AETLVGGHFFKRGANGPVGGNAACDDDVIRVGMAAADDADGVASPVADDVHNSRLEAGADVGDVGVGNGGNCLGGETDGGLQAREREIGTRPVGQRSRKGKAGGIAGGGGALDGGAARIGQ